MNSLYEVIRALMISAAIALFAGIGGAVAAVAVGHVFYYGERAFSFALLFGPITALVFAVIGFVVSLGRLMSRAERHEKAKS